MPVGPDPSYVYFTGDPRECRAYSPSVPPILRSPCPATAPHVDTNPARTRPSRMRHAGRRHMPLLVHVEVEAVVVVRIVSHPSAHAYEFGGHDLLLAPPAFVQHQVRDRRTSVDRTAMLPPPGVWTMRPLASIPLAETRAVHGISPGPESQRCREAQSHIIFHLHLSYLAEHHRRNVRRRCRIGVTPAGVACQRLTHSNIVGGSDGAILGRILQCLPERRSRTSDWCRGFPPTSRSTCPREISAFRGSSKGKYFRRQILGAEDLFIQPVWKQ